MKERETVPKVEISFQGLPVARNFVLRDDGTQVPRRFTAKFSGLTELPVSSVTLEVNLTNGGKARCVGMSLEGDPINGTTLRKLPMKTLMERAVYEAWSITGKREGSPGGLTKIQFGDGGGTDGELNELLADARGPWQPRQGSPLTPIHLRHIAAWVRWAKRDDASPVAAVREKGKDISRTGYVSRATAYRWIAAAREAGLDLGEDDG